MDLFVFDELIESILNSITIISEVSEVQPVTLPLTPAFIMHYKQGIKQRRGGVMKQSSTSSSECFILLRFGDYSKSTGSGRYKLHVA